MALPDDGALAAPRSPAPPPAAGRPAAAAALRAQHRGRVLGNQLSLAAGWGRPCLSYLLCIRPDADARAGLAAVQDAVAGPEPALLRIPPQALHLSVAWLLGVHETFARPKDELWAEYGPGWLAMLRTALAALPPFSLRLRELAATDTAVIAIADAPNPVTALRAELTGALPRPRNLPLSRGELVHTTLFRYRAPLAAPEAFLQRVAGAAVNLQVSVHEMALIREIVFPSLRFQTVQNFTLTPGVPAPAHLL
ncbi:MAG: 2'-5' RNA ligase family protein [Gemmatimonadota bacterium]